MISRHVAVYWSMIGCHMAQSWAATWYPGIGWLFCLLKNLESVGFNPQTSSKD
jgi:hypothetical protein